MLVLTRKAQQEVVIAGNIRLKVLEIRGGRVKIGFTAPDHINVRRVEAAPCSDDGRRRVERLAAAECG